MMIPPDCERIPCTGVAAGGSDVAHVSVDDDTARKTMPIPPDCECVPYSGITADGSIAGRETMPIPPDCKRWPGTGGDAGDPLFVRHCVHDGISVEVRFFRDGRRLQRAIESLASDHFILFGPRGQLDPPLLEAHKSFGWSTRLEVLG